MVLNDVLTEDLQIFSDSVSLMTRTITPRTFFERYHEAIKIADEVAAAYCAYELYDEVDEWCEKKEKLTASKDDLIVDLANRLYETFRIDALEELLMKYGRELTEDTEKHIEYLLKME